MMGIYNIWAALNKNKRKLGLRQFIRLVKPTERGCL